jgi:ribosomal protein S18 acetylase RimI-like enzyme
MPDPAEEAVTVRPAQEGDEPAVMALVPRLTEFGPPPWRDAERMTAVDRRKIADALRAAGEDPVVLVAISGGALAGFVHLHSATDHYGEKPHGHVSDIIVAPNFEGRGVGRRLIAAAQDWALERGFSWLTLSVFEENRRAAALYEGLGFGRDILRMVKPL